MKAPALWFDEVALQRMPGFESGGFTVPGFGPAINVVSGPNGSGKSTLARGMQALLWRSVRQDGQMLTARARLGDVVLRLELYAGQLTTYRDGVRGEPTVVVEEPHRYLLALPDLLAADEGDLATRLYQEAAGGYPLAEVAERLGRQPRPRAASQQRRAWRAATEQVERLRRDAQRLSHDGEGRELPDLQAALIACDEAVARAAVLGAVLDLRQAETALALALATYEAFPETVRLLDGSEAQRLVDMLQQLETAAQNVDEARAELERRRGEERDAQLPEDGLPGPVWTALTALGSALQETAGRRERAEQAAGEAASKVAARRAEMAPDLAPEQLAALLGDGLPPLSAWVRDAQRLAALDELLRRADEAFGGEPAPQVKALEDGLQHLQRWLAAQGTPSPPPLWPALGALLASFAGGTGLAPARLAAGWGWALVAGGAAAAVALLAYGWRRRRADPGQPWREAFTELHLTAPSSWTVDAVLQSAQQLRTDLAAAQLVALQRQEWQRYAALRDQAAELRATVEAEQQALCERFGLPTSTVPLELAQLHDQLVRWREAHDLQVAAEAEAARLRQAEADLLATLAERLALYGCPSPATAPEAVAQLRDLERRRTLWQQARDALARLEPQCDKFVARHGELSAQLDGWYTGLGLQPGDRVGLEQALARQPACAEAKEAVAEARLRLKQAAEAVPEGEPWADRDEATLRGWLEDAASQAARRDPLRDRLSALQERIRHAEEQQAVEAALAAADEAWDKLVARRDSDADAVVTDLLATQLEEQFRNEALPEVFQRAAALYGELTHEQYGLRLTLDGGRARFQAEDRLAGVVRELSELSSGNRVQLLLAVRLASIETDEGGGARLPLWLDEAMGTSDDARALAIIEAVATVAASGRQVIYLTAQADEVAKWRRHVPDAAFLDLASIRQLDTPTLPPIGPLPEPVPVPAPRELDHAGYGRLLAVPAISPWEPADRAHLWYAFWEPATLYRLLDVYGLTTWATYVGRTRTAGAEALGVSAESHRRAAARMEVLEALLHAWRQGRSRPVDPGVLARSDFGRSRFLGDVVAFAQECATTEEFLSRLTELDGIGPTRRDGLRDFLADEGYLADGEPSEPAAWLEAGLTAATSALGEGLLTRDEVAWLVALLPGVATA